MDIAHARLTALAPAAGFVVQLALTALVAAAGLLVVVSGSRGVDREPEGISGPEPRGQAASPPAADAPPDSMWFVFLFGSHAEAAAFQTALDEEKTVHVAVGEPARLSQVLVVIDEQAAMAAIEIAAAVLPPGTALTVVDQRGVAQGP